MSAALLLAGSFLVLAAAIGLLRLPDPYCRSHALGLGLCLGVSLMLVALWLELGIVASGIKVPLIILFQFLTVPVASHLLSMVARQKGMARYRPRSEARDKAKTQS